VVPIADPARAFPHMKAVFATAAVLAAALLAAPLDAAAQSTDRNGRGTGSTLPFRATTPPTAPGLGENAPPGFGGPNPGDAHRNGNARSQLPRIPSACVPGGALSGEATNGQIGRNRARERVCRPD
jgi:hypothetical protein